MSRRVLLLSLVTGALLAAWTSSAPEPVARADDPAPGWAGIVATPAAERRIGFELGGRGLELRSDAAAVHAHFGARAPDAYVAEQVSGAASSEQLARADRLRTNVYELPRHAAVELPADPAWTEDPHASRNWVFWYQRMYFARDLIAAGVATGDDWYLDRLVWLIGDWMHDNSGEATPAPMAWHDHASAFRLRNVLLTWAALEEAGRLTPERMSLLLETVWLHAEVLCDEAFYSRHSNHGLDQAYILYWAGSLFPEFRDAARWREIGRRRVAAELQFAFSPEGVHVENSPAYHHGMLVTALRVNRLFRHYGGEDVYPALAETVAGAMTFLTHATRPDGRFPIVGDSPASAVTDAFAGAVDAGLHAPFRYAIDAGRSGTPPERAAVVFPASGYAIFRDAWHPAATFAETFYLFYKCGYLAGYHRQDDDNHFLLYAYGEDWLIDSGLYKHEERDPLRRYMRSNRGHNVACIGGVAPSRDGAVLRGRSAIAAYALDAAGGSVTGVSGMYPGFVYGRTLSYERPDALRVSDLIAPLESGGPRTFEVLFHVPADKRIELGEDRIEIAGRARRLVLSLPAGYFDGARVVSGQQAGDDVQGFVSWQYGELEPAQCVVLEKTAERLHSEIRLHFEELGSHGE